MVTPMNPKTKKLSRTVITPLPPIRCLSRSPTSTNSVSSPKTAPSRHVSILITHCALEVQRSIPRARIHPFLPQHLFSTQPSEVGIFIRTARLQRSTATPTRRRPPARQRRRRGGRSERRARSNVPRRSTIPARALRLRPFDLSDLVFRPRNVISATLQLFQPRNLLLQLVEPPPLLGELIDPLRLPPGLATKLDLVREPLNLELDSREVALLVLPRHLRNGLLQPAFALPLDAVTVAVARAAHLLFHFSPRRVGPPLAILTHLSRHPVGLLLQLAVPQLLANSLQPLLLGHSLPMSFAKDLAAVDALVLAEGVRVLGLFASVVGS